MYCGPEEIVLGQEGLAQWCRVLALGLMPGDVVALCGDLGAGKTTAAGYIINSLLTKPEVITSPTFNLIHLYPWRNVSIWHFDLYRLKSAAEVYDLGWDQALEGLSIIEWPELVLHLLPRNSKIITITSVENSYERRISLK